MNCITGELLLTDVTIIGTLITNHCYKRLTTAYTTLQEDVSVTVILTIFVYSYINMIYVLYKMLIYSLRNNNNCNILCQFFPVICTKEVEKESTERTYST
jgi:uncharacterized membrane protein